MMKLTVQLRGVDTLSLRTKKLIAAAVQGAKDGVSEAAGLFQQEAKLQVPVDTGHLRDSIHSELVSAEAPRIQVIVTPVYEEPNEYGIEPAYARRIEFGFSGPDKLGRVYHQAAQSFMRTSFDIQSGAAREAIRESIYGALDAAQVTR